MAVATEHKVEGTWQLGERWDRAVTQQNPRINVGQTERWLSMIAGGALAVYGLKSRSTRGGAAAVAGAALLYRGSTGHCDVYQALGIDRGRGARINGHGGSEGTGVIADRHSDTRRQLGGARGIHVEESVTVNRPLTQVYRFWRDFENLPTFMQHLESVSILDEGLSRWVALGPAGMTIEWDARIINEVGDKLIAWQSVRGSTIAIAGSVNFEETERGTRVRVHLQYRLPAGKLGAAVAWLFGEEPAVQVRDDLRRFKALLEAGEIPTIDGQSCGRRTEGDSR